jgi:hypothetical protein
MAKRAKCLVPTPIVSDGMTFATVVSLDDAYNPASFDIGKYPKQHLEGLALRAFPQQELRVKRLKLANDFQFNLKVNEATGAMSHNIDNIDNRQSKTCRLVEDFLTIHKKALKEGLARDASTNVLGRHVVLKF